ncbi:DUF6470 family protein [Paenibacillus ginsengihumi]|jgi:hypothetical protein|uniref:DUF6470 family protein n=1 Tax=Paenibacillus ginsengihumi TaxID=431596 RepID=UPI00039A0D90|nr:DUF6470 family protein [Paenibacillus ginsengihumi]
MVSGVRIPQIQIVQQPAKLGIDADLGQQELRQPRAKMDMKTVRPRLEIDAEFGKLYIDNSRVWDALGRGPHLEVMHRIYSECRNIALQGIAKIVEDGNRMAAIHTGENAIKALAEESTRDIDFFEYMYMGEASFDNIDMRYEPGTLDIQYIEGDTNIEVQVNPPEHRYTRGKLDVYMLQYPKVEITPPRIDLKR